MASGVKNLMPLFSGSLAKAKPDLEGISGFQDLVVGPAYHLCFVWVTTLLLNSYTYSLALTWFLQGVFFWADCRTVLHRRSVTTPVHRVFSPQTLWFLQSSIVFSLPDETWLRLMVQVRMQTQPPVCRKAWHLWTISLIKNLGAYLVSQMVKNSPAMQETQGSIPGLGRSPGEGNGNPLQYSCLENSMGRAAWRATVHEVAKHRTSLSN